MTVFSNLDNSKRIRFFVSENVIYLLIYLCQSLQENIALRINHRYKNIVKEFYKRIIGSTAILKHTPHWHLIKIHTVLSSGPRHHGSRERHGDLFARKTRSLLAVIKRTTTGTQRTSNQIHRGETQGRQMPNYKMHTWWEIYMWGLDWVHTRQANTRITIRKSNH